MPAEPLDPLPRTQDSRLTLIFFSNSAAGCGVIPRMNKSSRSSGISRRHFLAATALTVAAPTFIPASALGRGGRASPSDRITAGVVGWGMQGPGNTNELLRLNDVQVVAACDLDKRHLQSALDKINGHYKNQDCKPYHDYRELMARKDIDAVMIAVPDTWHALVAIEALKNGKDVYGEKPLARTIAEQQAMVKAVQKNKRIWQTGSWQRSVAPFRKAAEIVRNGLIGKITRVEVGLPAGHHDFAGTAPALLAKFPSAPKDSEYLTKVLPGTPDWNIAVTQPPPELDYDRWLGPSQMEPYIQARVFMNWRWNYNVGGGQLLDWIGHHCDIAHWGMDMDNGGPSEIDGQGDFPPKEAIWNTCGKYRIELKYPQDMTMIIAGGHKDIRGGTKWIGTEGWVWVDRGGYDATNVDWFAQIPEDRYKVKLYKSDNHMRNFIDCVKSRQPTITPIETAHHSAIPGHLGLISMLVGHKIKWDAAKEKIIGDSEASKLLSRPYRKPWKLA
jgi:predicted dehydrogenase